ncbi:hypothetical protein HPP92_012315 [Vanilla planifolia]|uniref:Uncharacterized protein n=1 Tax=Vanilla planifolia TaxID=51239 RepID=A0A835R7H6_VANPL|nr:hypothetical protein HPP92_012315 [Vanilla planifolia]
MEFEPLNLDDGGLMMEALALWRLMGRGLSSSSNVTIFGNSKYGPVLVGLSREGQLVELYSVCPTSVLRQWGLRNCKQNNQQSRFILSCVSWQK